MRLPLLADGESAGGRPRPAAERAGGGPGPRRVLVVDDNRDAADSLAMLLRLAGREVAWPTTARPALAAAEADPPDIALLDLGMPKMDGYELARRVPARRPWRGSCSSP